MAHPPTPNPDAVHAAIAHALAAEPNCLIGDPADIYPGTPPSFFRQLSPAEHLRIAAALLAAEGHASDRSPSRSSRAASSEVETRSSRDHALVIAAIRHVYFGESARGAAA